MNFFMVLFFSIAANASYVGFVPGNQFEVYNLGGTVRVTCDDGTFHDVALIRCRENILSPAEMVYFANESGVDADKVRLTATRDDGSEFVKTKRFLASEGRTRTRVNLWISTLLQRPLLRMGKNIITFEMLKNGKPVEQGVFEVQVNFGGDRSCRYDYMHSRFKSDCRGTSVCWEYFRRQNYCR